MVVEDGVSREYGGDSEGGEDGCEDSDPFLIIFVNPR